MIPAIQPFKKQRIHGPESSLATQSSNSGESSSEVRVAKEALSQLVKSRKEPALEVHELLLKLFPGDVLSVIRSLLPAGSPFDVRNSLAILREGIKENASKGYQDLANWININRLTLKSLDLSDSELNGIAKHLKYLNFGYNFDFSGWDKERVYNFIESCSSINFLKISNKTIDKLPPITSQLIELNCKRCFDLKELQEMPNLVKLNLEACQSLECIPNGMKKLTYLKCVFTSIAALPEDMEALVELDCSNCRNLVTLPLMMKSLARLDCRFCHHLLSLPTEMGTMSFLDYRDCPLLVSEKQGVLPEQIISRVKTKAEYGYCIRISP